jgi:hypothetical protein
MGNENWPELVALTSLSTITFPTIGAPVRFLANLDQFVEFIRDGQFDQIAQNRAGQLIAEGHAAKLLNMRPTLLTLAGGDATPSAAISELLSMRTGQGYAESGCPRLGPTPRWATPTRPPASGTSTCWPAARPPSTAARRRCSSTSPPNGCWGAARPVGRRGRPVRLARSIPGLGFGPATALMLDLAGGVGPDERTDALVPSDR